MVPFKRCPILFFKSCAGSISRTTPLTLKDTSSCQTRNQKCYRNRKMSTHKLSFIPSEPDLSDTAKGYLEKRFMREDYESYWLSIESLIEDLGGCDGTTIFGDVKL